MSELAHPEEIRRRVRELGQAFGVTGEEYAARVKASVAIVASAGVTGGEMLGCPEPSASAPASAAPHTTAAAPS